MCCLQHPITTSKGRAVIRKQSEGTAFVCNRSDAGEREIVLGGKRRVPSERHGGGMGANTIGCLPRPAKTPQSHFQQHKASINSINTSKVSLYRLRQKHHHRHHCPCSRFNHGALISRPIKSCVNHYEVCESDYTGCPTDRGQSLKSDPKKHGFFFFFFFSSFLFFLLR